MAKQKLVPDAPVAEIELVPDAPVAVVSNTAISPIELGAEYKVINPFIDYENGHIKRELGEILPQNTPIERLERLLSLAIIEKA